MMSSIILILNYVFFKNFLKGFYKFESKADSKVCDKRWICGEGDIK